MTYKDGYRIGQDMMYHLIKEAAITAESGKPLGKLRASCNPNIAELQETIYLAILGEEHDTQLKPYEEL